MQDHDGAHASPKVLKWAEVHNLPLMTFPSTSAKLSISEIMAKQAKNDFHSNRSASIKAGIARFKKTWDEMDHEKIRELYSWYTKRLHECKRLRGKATRYLIIIITIHHLNSQTFITVH